MCNLNDGMRLELNRKTGQVRVPGEGQAPQNVEHPLQHVPAPRANNGDSLRTEGLTKSYGGRTVVRDVDLEVRSGEIVGLLGPNGAGKTTTFGMVVGLTAPDHGRVALDDQDLTRDPMYVRARKGIGYLPQEASIFRGLTVEQNILAILETLPIDAGDAPGAAGGSAQRTEPDAAGAVEGLHAVGRRAPPRRDHARARQPAEVHAARRAVCRHRSDRRGRHPEASSFT